MKKITLLFLFTLATTVSFGQFSFPAQAGPVISGGTEVIVNVNDAANAAGVPAGLYTSYTVTADWENLDNAWSSEERLSVVTAGGASEALAPSNGANNTTAVVGLSYSGDLAAAYDPSVDGTLNLAITRTFTSDAQLTNIVVTINLAPACGDPTSASASASFDSADISWGVPTAGTPTGYNWEVQPTGVAQGTAGAIGSGTTTMLMVSVAGLTVSTTYDAYLQTDCGADGSSAWIGPISFTTTAGPPPANDDFANAIAVACDGNYLSDTSVATLDEDDAPDGFGADNDAPNVWYTYTGSGVEEEVTIDLCASGYDTAFLVYTGTSGNLSIVAGNDDNAAICGAGFRSFGSFISDGTSTYYLCITGFGPTSTGPVDMTITCASTVPAPGNDDCAAAEVLTLGTAFSGTNVGATQSVADQPSCDTFGSISDVWFSVVAPATGELKVTTTPGTADQANVAIYSNCGGLSTDEVAGSCSDGNGGEVVNVTGLIAGTTYYIRLWNDGNAAVRTEGDFTILVEDATLSVGNDVFETFKYFPNPVEGVLSLRAQNNIENVAIYNMLGQKVVGATPNALSSDVNMSNLNSGAYFVKVTINGATETVRIIKE